jgi:hypothetical protein
MGADVGIYLIENSCLNHYYSRPNKIFQYLFSSLPLVVSDFAEIGKIVDESNRGC